MKSAGIGRIFINVVKAEDVCLCGTLQQIRSIFERWETEERQHLENGGELRIEVNQPVWGDVTLDLYLRRLETDSEFNNRVRHEKEAEMKSALRKATSREAKLKQYEELKKELDV